MLRLRHLAAASTVLCLSVAPAFAGVPGAYSGRTSDKRHVSFRLSANQIRSFAFQTRFTCSDHTGFVASATFPSIKLTGHRFSGAFRNKSGSTRTTIRGTITGRRASGTIRRRATFNSARKLDPRGHLLCTSSTRFTARR